MSGAYNITPEMEAIRVAKSIATRAGWSEEKKREVNQKRSATLRKRFAERPKDLEVLRAMRARATRDGWTDAQRLCNSKRISQAHKKAEVESQRLSAFHSTINCRGKAELARVGQSVRQARLSLSPEKKALRKLRVQQAWKNHTPEHKKRFSEIQSANNVARILSEGIERMHVSRIHGYFESKKNGKSIFYASGLELNAFEKLEVDETVAAYSRCTFWIPYYSTFDSKNHRYLPDILVTRTSGQKEVIEVKPEWVCHYENNPDKIKAGREYCEGNGLSFAVWTDRELKVSNG
jgi:hypothetical protein